MAAVAAASNGVDGSIAARVGAGERRGRGRPGALSREVDVGRVRRGGVAHACHVCGPAARERQGERKRLGRGLPAASKARGLPLCAALAAATRRWMRALSSSSSAATSLMPVLSAENCPTAGRKSPSSAANPKAPAPGRTNP